MMKKIMIAGVTGAMGQKTLNLVNELPDCQLVGAFAPDLSSKTVLPENTKRFNNLADFDLTADIWIDFTTPHSVFANTKFALEHKIHPIVGTSGLTDAQVKELQAIAVENNVGGIIVPNFGLSAVLLMKFAKEAAKYFPDAEVIEMHHADKLDAPSGTAVKTAELIAQSRKQQSINQDDDPARGENCYGVKVHSVRLPGYIAHEQVLFGGTGEALTIRQDSFDRQSFMQGVKVAIENVLDLSELVVGLENVL